MLNLHPSNFFSYGNLIPYPNSVIMHDYFGYKETVISSFSAQINLHKRLQEICCYRNNMEDPECDTHFNKKQALKDIDENTFQNCYIWAGRYRFDLNAPPSNDILHAHFQAKFWEAMILAYQPTIQHIVERSYRKAHPEEYPGYIAPALDKTILKNARKGLTALTKSMQAFHNLPDNRFITTNVFLIAHR